MKRYTKSHLESVDPSWIAAVEEMIELEPDEDGEYGCPPEQEDLVLDRKYLYQRCVTCNVAFGYGVKEPCPCYHFNGCENAIKEALNLITQWKKWAGIK